MWIRKRREESFVRAFVLLLPFLLAAALSACDRPTRVEPFTVSGPWVGTARSITFNLTLREDGDGQIRGSGNTTLQGQGTSLEVTGTHAPPSVSLLISNPQFAPFNFRGGFASPDTLHGELHGSGFDSDRVVFIRER
jgi:hypothetical protein